VSERLAPLGEITTTHGLDGWLKVKLYNPQSTRLTPDLGIWLETGGARWAHKIQASRPYKDQFLVQLATVLKIDEAKKWVGSVLYVAVQELDPLRSGEYYHYQVIGFEVFDVTGQRIGVVARTWSTPGGELYIVRGESKEHLIPATKEIIEKVDFAAGTLVINPPEGLLDL
jgi:16S rRNA processing protein RimM